MNLTRHELGLLAQAVGLVLAQGFFPADHEDYRDLEDKIETGYRSTRDDDEEE